MFELLLLLLPVAAASGWYAARRSLHNPAASPRRNTLQQDYFVGLNYLLNEQPDKAVDVFIKAIEIDTETVETHLALGNLFRRRGEVDRAIRVHQNLIARPQLKKAQRIKALLALAQDYFKAGVLDRAERVFLDVVETGEYVAEGLRQLIEVYQQQKQWDRAIEIAKRYSQVTGESMARQIAHYYCELAEGVYPTQLETVREWLRHALQQDPMCVRASLLQGRLEERRGNLSAAISAFRQVKRQNPEYLSESILPLVACYERLGDEASLMEYLQTSLSEYPRISIILVLADRIQIQQGIQAAEDFIAAELQRCPSLRGLKRLIELHIQGSEGKAKANLTILNEITASLLSTKPIYQCNHCGLTSKTLYWQCPGCHQWSSITPIHGLEGD